MAPSRVASGRDGRLQELVSSACHELRTPLTSLHATLELLQEELRRGAVDRAQALAYTDIAVRQTRRLVELATELLDLSRLDAEAPPALRPVEVAELARCVEQEFGARLTAADRSLRVEGGPATALADPLAVKRILAILVDNATSYGAGPVTLTVVRDGKRVTVAVTDRGPGVAPDERERIFERFVRGSAGAAAAGAGLGLAIARGLARAMGGELRAVPNPRGARFVLTLPAA
jgi:signal transduction histidine kinase